MNIFLQRLQGFGSAATNQGGYGESNAPTSQQSGAEPPNPSLTNGSHEIPQIRGHVNVSMTHLQQEQQMPKLETELNQQVPTNNQAQPPQQQQALDQSMNYHQQQQRAAPQQQQQQQGPQSSETMNMKTYYENEDEDTIIDEHFTKSFAPESRARCKFNCFGHFECSGILFRRFLNLHILLRIHTHGGDQVEALSLIEPGSWWWWCVSV